MRAAWDSQAKSVSRSPRAQSSKVLQGLGRGAVRAADVRAGVDEVGLDRAVGSSSPSRQLRAATITATVPPRVAMRHSHPAGELGNPDVSEV